MNTIWKERLKLTPVQEIEIPGDAEILSVAIQFKSICIWYRCNPEVPKKRRQIAIWQTGQPCPEGEGRFIGTVLMEDFVFHVLEELDDLRIPLELHQQKRMGRSVIAWRELAE